MAASSTAPGTTTVSTSGGGALATLANRYGLLALLLVLPVVYGIQDPSRDGDLSRLANNLFAGLQRGRARAHRRGLHARLRDHRASSTSPTATCS